MGLPVEAVASFVADFPTSTAPNAKPLSILLVGSEAGGMHYLADLLGAAIGRSAAVDLSRDLAPGRAALSAEASKRVAHAVGSKASDGSRAVPALLKVSALEAADVTNVTALAVLMRLLDSHPAIATTGEDVPFGRDGAGVVLLTFDAPAAGLAPSLWADADRAAARKLLLDHFTALNEGWVARRPAVASALAAAEGALSPTKRALNIDALFGRIDHVVVLPPLPPAEAAALRAMRGDNELCAAPPILGGKVKGAPAAGAKKPKRAKKGPVADLAGNATTATSAWWAAARTAATDSWAAVVRVMEPALYPLVAGIESGAQRLAGVVISPQASAFALGMALPALAVLLMLLLPGQKKQPAGVRGTHAAPTAVRGAGAVAAASHPRSASGVFSPEMVVAAAHAARAAAAASTTAAVAAAAEEEEEEKEELKPSKKAPVGRGRKAAGSTAAPSTKRGATAAAAAEEDADEGGSSSQRNGGATRKAEGHNSTAKSPRAPSSSRSSSSGDGLKPRAGRGKSAAGKRAAK